MTAVKAGAYGFLTKPFDDPSHRSQADAQGRPRGETPPAERDWATAAAVSAAVVGGAHIVRVHAVREMVQVARVSDEIRKYHRGD